MQDKTFLQVSKKGNPLLFCLNVCLSSSESRIHVLLKWDFFKQILIFYVNCLMNILLIFTIFRKGSPVTLLKGKLKFIGNAHNSNWAVDIPGQYPYRYWILDTDYKNYAVLFSCINILSVR